MCASNIGSFNYVKLTLTELRGEIHRNTTIVGDFDTTLSLMDSTSRQKINKEREL